MLWIRAVSRVDASRWKSVGPRLYLRGSFCWWTTIKRREAHRLRAHYFRDAKRSDARKSDPAREEKAAKRSRSKATETKCKRQ